MDKTTQALKEQFRLLRVSINSMFAEHTPLKSGARIITIVSALPDDGRSFVADGLADAYADCGMTTALVDQSFAYAGDLYVDNQDGFFDTGKLVTVPFPGANGHTTRDAHALSTELRQRFDVVIVAASAIRPSEAVLSFLTASSGVLIAVRFGRKKSPKDAELAELLQKLGTPVLGTVPTGAEARSFKPLHLTSTAVPVVTGMATPQTV